MENFLNGIPTILSGTLYNNVYGDKTREIASSDENKELENRSRKILNNIAQLIELVEKGMIDKKNIDEINSFLIMYKMGLNEINNGWDIRYWGYPSKKVNGTIKYKYMIYNFNKKEYIICRSADKLTYCTPTRNEMNEFYKNLLSAYKRIIAQKILDDYIGKKIINLIDPNKLSGRIDLEKLNTLFAFYNYDLELKICYVRSAGQEEDGNNELTLAYTGIKNKDIIYVFSRKMFISYKAGQVREAERFEIDKFCSELLLSYEDLVKRGKIKDTLNIIPLLD